MNRAWTVYLNILCSIHYASSAVKSIGNFTSFAKTKRPNLIFGVENSEESGVYRLNGDLLPTRTMDSLTSILNGPWFSDKLPPPTF
jgi:hypothetical protein